MSTKVDSSGGVSVIGLLGVSFIILKLTGFIDWSWWWVTAPFWGGFALVIGGFALFYVVAGLVKAVAWSIERVLNK